MTARRSIPVLAVLLSALVLAACSSTAPETTPTEAPPTAAAPSSPAPSPSVSDAPTDEPTCETILPGDTVADFEELGWSARSEPFRAGAVEVAGGVQCTWGDYSVATDHVQIFGWAPIDSATTDAAIDELVGSGWLREDSEDGVYVTENPQSVIAPDENGYGFTYLFGDGFAKVADTRQGLVLVEWPPVG